MTTQEVANRLVALCREGKMQETINELFADNATSTEPNESMGPRVVEGKQGILGKTAHFNSMVEEFHGQEISEPVVSDTHFSLSWMIDVTMKERGRMRMSEICVYKVEEGKIVSEQFFF